MQSVSILAIAGCTIALKWRQKPQRLTVQNLGRKIGLVRKHVLLFGFTSL